MHACRANRSFGYHKYYPEQRESEVENSAIFYFSFFLQIFSFSILPKKNPAFQLVQFARYLRLKNNMRL